MDVMPQAPGHTLVIPKFETTDLINLPDEYLDPLLKATKISQLQLKNILPYWSNDFTAQWRRGRPNCFPSTFPHYPKKRRIEYKFHSRDIEDTEILENEAKKFVKLLLFNFLFIFFDDFFNGRYSKDNSLFLISTFIFPPFDSFHIIFVRQ